MSKENYLFKEPDLIDYCIDESREYIIHFEEEGLIPVS